MNVEIIKEKQVKQKSNWWGRPWYY